MGVKLSILEVIGVIWYSDLVNLSGWSLDIFLSKKNETGPGMLYIVGKIFLYGISFNMVYNESVHENRNNF